ncbi:MAG: hypothetical protein KJO02_09320 [Erythrobacter sp.]|nr:hypothetical protein [Erythrobacter sp.]
MQRANYLRLYRSAKAAVLVGMAVAFLFFGSFIADGEYYWVGYLAVLPAFLLIGRLVLVKCQNCRKGPWSGFSESAAEMRTPDKLDICPHCGERFFHTSSKAGS